MGGLSGGLLDNLSVSTSLKSIPVARFVQADYPRLPDLTFEWKCVGTVSHLPRMASLLQSSTCRNVNLFELLRISVLLISRWSVLWYVLNLKIVLLALVLLASNRTTLLVTITMYPLYIEDEILVNQIGKKDFTCTIWVSEHLRRFDPLMLDSDDQHKLGNRVWSEPM